MKEDMKQGYLVLRIAMGLNMLGHGGIRIFGNYTGFHDWIMKTFAESSMPLPLVSLTGWIIPPVEFVVGLLLILGLKTRAALWAGSGLMMMLIMGSCMIQNWEILGIQMIYVFLYAILLAFISNNTKAIDTLTT